VYDVDRRSHVGGVDAAIDDWRVLCGDHVAVRPVKSVGSTDARVDAKDN
jgi:hypothetical protein